MTRQDIERLLGGYATGTLTPEEEQALFAAALEDQELFDTLVREQPLRDLLHDPTARASLLTALTEERVPWYRRFARPLVAAAALVCVAVPLALWQLRHPKPQPVLTADIRDTVKLPETQPTVPAPAAPAELPRARTETNRPVGVREKASAEPVARQVKSKPEPPAALAAAPNAINRLQAAPGAVAPTAKDVMAQGDQVGIVGGASQSIDGSVQQKTLQIQSSNGFLPSTRRAAAGVGTAAPLMAAKEALTHLRWTVLRRQSDGEFVVADAANLRAGDTVKLRLEADEAGDVHVVEGQKSLSSPIYPGKPFERTLEQQGAGERSVDFWFTRRAVVSQVLDGTLPVDSPRPPSTHITLTYK